MSVRYYRGLEVRTLHRVMSFCLFSVGPGVGVKSGGKSVCLSLMDAADPISNLFMSVQRLSYLSFISALSHVQWLVSLELVAMGQASQERQVVSHINL